MKKLHIIFIFLFLVICAQLVAQIQHVEPLNWWVGMKNPHLQLLIQGNNVGEMTPHIHYKGVSIQKVSKGDSKNYLFIDLEIAENTKAGTFEIDFQQDKKTIYTYKYSLLAREKGTAEIQGFSSKDVIYLITPDRFANGDEKNDVVAEMKETKIDRNFEGARHGGDIRGIINHLDYIADMGFTAIWSTPLLENDMPDYSYHGYAITDYYKVDKRFGTMEEYKELAIKAKAKGLKLIFDGVMNHSGSFYWWMKDLPFKDWINYPDSFQMTNHRRTVNQDKYASKFDKELMTKGWFWKTMPDMNGKNPFLATYLIQNSIWWIETLQLGGIRQDTYCYSDKEFSQKWSCSIMKEYPNFSIVGEEWSYNPLITSYWQQGKQNHDGYAGCLKSSMDFPLQMALVQALKEPEDSDFSKGLTRIYEALANDFVYANPKNMLVMCDNHDMDRIFTQLNKDVALTKMALTYLLTIRGIPQMYYGTEILLENSEHPNNHGFIRADFPGGWQNDKQNGFSGEGLSAEQKEMQAYLRKLLNWRKNNAVIAEGETLHFAPFEGIYAFCRYEKSRLVMVILNKNAKEMKMDTKRFAEVLGGKSFATNVITGEKMSVKTPLLVAGKTAVVLEIE